MTVTEAQIRIMCHQFESTICPVCAKTKQVRWCFCRSCYYAIKTGNRKLAAGLWYDAFDGTDRFFESYQAAKGWLLRTGLQNQKHDSEGGLFA